MTDSLEVLERFMLLVRSSVLFVAVVFAIICILDWAVRTRKINPFNPVARFFRDTIDPFIAPIERRVVRAGHLPSSAPLWALGVVVIGGIVLIAVLQFIVGNVTALIFASQNDPRGLFRVLLGLTFGLLRLALFVTVICSWFRIDPYSRWVHWAFRLSEPILRPLRTIIPPIGGMLDITPIIAYFLLGILQSFLLGAM